MKKAAASLVLAGVLLKSCSAQGIDLSCANQVVQASEGCGQSLELFCSTACYGIALQYYCRTPDDRSALIDACAVSYPASNYPGLSDISSLPSESSESSATTSAPDGEATSSSADEDNVSSAASDATPTSSAAGVSPSSNSTDCEGDEHCTESAEKPAKTKGPHKNETDSDSAAMLTFQPAANPVLVGMLGATLAYLNAWL